MDHTVPDVLQSKDDKRTSNNPGASDQDMKRPIRRVRTPPRPTARLPRSFNPKFAGKLEDHAAHHRYPHPKFHYPGRDHHLTITKRLAAAPKREERYDDQRKRGGKSSNTKQNNSFRVFLPRSTSSKDKDKQFVSKSDRSKSRESDHRGSRSSERERNRDEEHPSAASQAAARDRAIQKKRKEIDEVYYQECEMFGLVVKMLIAKDPSLEVPIQASLQQNLRDIGARCVKAMEKFIAEYDSRESSQ